MTQNGQPPSGGEPVSPEGQIHYYPGGNGLTRRELLGLAAIGGGLLYLGIDSLDYFTDNEHKKDPMVKELFASAEANQVAENLLITHRSYWHTETDTMEAIRNHSEWDKEQKLLPIYPPAVMKYEPEMQRVSEELDIPINIMGIVSSIESAGKTDAHSSVANGLFQVVPEFHREKIDRVAKANGLGEPANDEERIKILQNPYVGCRVGMEILLEYREGVIAENPGLNPDSPVIWARALAAYNGGPSNSGKRYEDMPLESQLYAVHAIRYITDAAIASGLRHKGMDDQSIHDAMISHRIDEDTYTYSKIVEASKGLDTITDYERVWSAIAGDPRRKLKATIRQARKSFRNGESDYQLPLTPALRIWAAHGGLALLEQSPINMQPVNYRY